MSTMNVNSISNEAGTGAPSFPNGASVTGTVTATTVSATTVAATTITGDGSALTGITPTFNPVAVTGTTPSLNVGSYNFFDNGTLTADTTVSFASVPTNAKWQYSFKTILASGDWDVSTAVYKQAFFVGTEELSPQGVFFKPDGTKMYVVGSSGDDVNEYDLSTAWDISSAVYLQLFSVAAQDTTPTGIFFKPDGLKMYVIGETGDDVNEYNLSTAWDISTAVYLQLFSVATQETTPTGIFFKPDGLKMYVTGDTGDDINEYNLSTAWNISTAVYLQRKALGTQESGPMGAFFKPDGLKMYVTGTTGDNVYEYDLSTAWNVTTAVYLQLFRVATQEDAPQGVFFKPDGTKMYVVGTTEDSVYEYDLGTATAVTLPAAVVGTPSAIAAGDRVTYEFFTLDAGVTVNLIGEEIV